MNMIKCVNEHYYDRDKFLSCPHCANQHAGVTIDDILGIAQEKISTAIPTSNKLQNYHKAAHGKTVGWLVCIVGAMIGESFILREGDNYIGRDANMDVALLFEPTVSREQHAIISYDSVKRSCILFSADHAEQTLCNGKVVKRKKTLKKRDTITLGDCSLVFVPFCNTSFGWEDTL